MGIYRVCRTTALLYTIEKMQIQKALLCEPKIRRGFSLVSFKCLSNIAQNLSHIPVKCSVCNFHESSQSLRLSQTTVPARLQNVRTFKSQGDGSSYRPGAKGSKSTIYYIGALGVVALGLSYAAVPLYRIFCQAYSYGGTVSEGHDADKVATMEKVPDRIIRVRFNADTAASMTWNFKPQQHEIKVLPGETALAFYTARNPTDHPVIGVSTYNVIPFDAGQYFNKIQCFCFEEQLLNPHEEVHMPVFFYIDPEFAADPKMENVDMLTLSYTFFEVREGVQIPIPSFAKN